MVNATKAVFKDAIQNFLPTPSKSHYVFNLRDFARVIKGVLLVPATHLKEGDKLYRLWIHEVYRVFYDRLIDQDDREVFFNMVSSSIKDHFKSSIDKVLVHLTKTGKVVDDDIRSLFFGDYVFPDAVPKVYDEVPDMEQLTSLMEQLVIINDVILTQAVVTYHYINFKNGRGKCLKCWSSPLFSFREIFQLKQFWIKSGCDFFNMIHLPYLFLKIFSGFDF